MDVHSVGTRVTFSTTSCAPAVFLSVLCLHGCRQNGQTFREKTGAFRKIIKSRANLDQRGWWFSRENGYYRALDETDCDKGFQESLDIIRTAFQTQGPFDGVIAFSQGASFLSLLCCLLGTERGRGIEFDFAVIIAGFRSRSGPHQSLYSNQLSLPSLHVFGDTDTVIPKAVSEELTQYFVNPTILQHPGGHFVPASSAQKKGYTDFLDQMIERKKLKG